MDCTTCQAGHRKIWGPSKNRPDLCNIDIGNWISLERCPECNVFWVDSPYEPYASFSYRVRWMSSQTAWRRLHNLDNGHGLRELLNRQIKMLWKTLPKDERESVEFHRKRSYGHYNPIDMATIDDTETEQTITEIESVLARDG